MFDTDALWDRTEPPTANLVWGCWGDKGGKGKQETALCLHALGLALNPLHRAPLARSRASSVSVVLVACSRAPPVFGVLVVRSRAPSVFVVLVARTVRGAAWP